MSEIIVIVGIVVFTIAIVVANDLWKRRLSAENTSRHRLRDLNRPMGILEKVWTTFVLLVFGVLVTPLLVIGWHQVADPFLHELLAYVLEAVAVFYVALVVYIWWRPRWIARIYDSVESKLVKTAYVACGIIVIGAAFGLSHALARL
jgi:hypothetical protein